MRKGSDAALCADPKLDLAGVYSKPFSLGTEQYIGRAPVGR